MTQDTMIGLSIEMPSLMLGEVLIVAGNLNLSTSKTIEAMIGIMLKELKQEQSDHRLLYPLL